MKVIDLTGHRTVYLKAWI